VNREFLNRLLCLYLTQHENRWDNQVQPPRVGTVPNAAVQHGPIALPNLLCTLGSVAQNLCPRNGPANA
jgi:hypothetical protein